MEQRIAELETIELKGKQVQQELRERAEFFEAVLNEEPLGKMGFKSIGINVRVSDKASIYNPDQIEIGTIRA